MATLVAGWGLFELMRRQGMPSRGTVRGGSLRGLPDHDPIWPRLPTRCRHAGRHHGGPGLLGSVRIGRRRHWLVLGWSLLALGFAVKISAAFLLIPLVIGILRTRRMTGILAACATLLPAILWYVWADHLVAGGGGSRASSDNRAIWLGLLGPSALANRDTWELVFRLLFIRAFTPMGMALAVLGLFHCVAHGSRGDRSNKGPFRLWGTWVLAASITLAILARKLHHEYYFLILAPAAAAGIGYALNRLANIRRVGAYAILGILIMLCILQARSTWRMPDEWEGLVDAARAVATETPADAWIVAPEALLFQADRRGCRLEWTPSSVRRAAGEWGAEGEVQGPLDLVECYRLRGARYFADLGDRRADPAANGLARRGTATIQGHCGSPRGHHR